MGLGIRNRWTQPLANGGARSPSSSQAARCRLLRRESSRSIPSSPGDSVDRLSVPCQGRAPKADLHSVLQQEDCPRRISRECARAWTVLVEIRVEIWGRQAPGRRWRRHWQAKRLESRKSVERMDAIPDASIVWRMYSVRSTE